MQAKESDVVFCTIATKATTTEEEVLADGALSNDWERDSVSSLRFFRRYEIESSENTTW